MFPKFSDVRAFAQIRASLMMAFRVAAVVICSALLIIAARWHVYEAEAFCLIIAIIVARAIQVWRHHSLPLRLNEFVCRDTLPSEPAKQRMRRKFNRASRFKLYRGNKNRNLERRRYEPTETPDDAA